VPPHINDSEKTDQGTTENGLGESNPAAVKQLYQKKYPFSSPLTEVIAGGKNGYGLSRVIVEGTVACATQRSSMYGIV